MFSCEYCEIFKNSLFYKTPPAAASVPLVVCTLLTFHFKLMRVRRTFLKTEALAQTCSVRKVFLEISQKFTKKHLCQSLFFNKVTGLRPESLLKKRLSHRCFPVNFAKILRTYFLTEHLRWLLL